MTHFITIDTRVWESDTLSFDNSLWGGVNCFVGQLLFIIADVAVDCYVLITGYFMVGRTQFCLKKLLGIWYQVVLYSISIYMIWLCISQLEISELKFCILPIYYNTYWFVTKYLALIALAPFISKAILSLNKQHYIILLSILFLLNFQFDKYGFGRVFSGSGSLLLFVFLFILGGYIRKYDIRIRRPLLWFFVVVSIIFMLELHKTHGLCLDGLWYIDKTYLWNNNAIMIPAILLFIFFKRMKCDSQICKYVTKVSSYTFAVYLIHFHPCVRNYIFDDLFKVSYNMNSAAFLPICVFGSVAIFSVCLCIDYCVKKIPLYHIIPQRLFLKIKDINI